MHTIDYLGGIHTYNALKYKLHNNISLERQTKDMFIQQQMMAKFRLTKYHFNPPYFVDIATRLEGKVLQFELRSSLFGTAMRNWVKTLNSVSLVQVWVVLSLRVSFLGVCLSFSSPNNS